MTSGTINQEDLGLIQTINGLDDKMSAYWLGLRQSERKIEEEEKQKRRQKLRNERFVYALFIAQVVLAVFISLLAARPQIKSVLVFISLLICFILMVKFWFLDKSQKVQILIPIALTVIFLSLSLKVITTEELLKKALLRIDETVKGEKISDHDSIKQQDTTNLPKKNSKASPTKNNDKPKKK